MVQNLGANQLDEQPRTLIFPATQKIADMALDRIQACLRIGNLT